MKQAESVWRIEHSMETAATPQAAARLYEFIEYTRESGLRLLECSLKKATLEESFLKILRGDKDLNQIHQS